MLGAIVANRWFLRHRGLMIGVFSAASATGQLVFLPIVATLTDNVGWRQTTLLIAASALVLIPFVLVRLAESPAAVGLRPYGDPAADDVPEPGAGAAASIGALIRTSTGDYAAAWYAAGLLCVIAAFAVLRIPRPPEPDPAGQAKPAPVPEHITPLA